VARNAWFNDGADGTPGHAYVKEKQNRVPSIEIEKRGDTRDKLGEEATDDGGRGLDSDEAADFEEQEKAHKDRRGEEWEAN
jgi:hypothetical protein